MSNALQISSYLNSVTVTNQKGNPRLELHFLTSPPSGQGLGVGDGCLEFYGWKESDVQTERDCSDGVECRVL